MVGVAGFRYGDDDLIRGGRGGTDIAADALNARVADAALIDRLTDMVLVRSQREAHINEGAALEIHAARHAVPQQHAQNAGGGEDEREGQKEPLAAQPVDIAVAKEFHGFLTLDGQRFAAHLACEHAVKDHA